MEQFIKDFGTILAPIIAFLLGVVALYANVRFVEHREKKQAEKSFKKAKMMLATATLPPFEKSIHKRDECSIGDEQNKTIFLHASDARNMTYLAGLYFQLSATQLFFAHIKDGVIKTNNSLLIYQYFYITWRLDRLVFQIRSAREEKILQEQTHSLLRSDLLTILGVPGGDIFFDKTPPDKHYSFHALRGRILRFVSTLRQSNPP